VLLALVAEIDAVATVTELNARHCDVTAM
jgi:hypothetical protein